MATWLGIDKLAIEIDEAFNREEMHAEMLGAVEEEKVKLKATLYEQQSTLINSLSTVVESRLDDIFIPARDGL